MLDVDIGAEVCVMYNTQANASLLACSMYNLQYL